MPATIALIRRSSEITIGGGRLAALRGSEAQPRRWRDPTARRHRHHCRFPPSTILAQQRRSSSRRIRSASASTEKRDETAFLLFGSQGRNYIRAAEIIALVEQRQPTNLGESIGGAIDDV